MEKDLTARSFAHPRALGRAALQIHAPLSEPNARPYRRW